MLNRDIFTRIDIPKYTKFEEKPKEGRHLINYKQKKLYEYYKCDYCNDEIIIKNKILMNGGIQVFPKILTKSKDIKVVLCNKCLKAVIKEFEDRMISENYNHIPRID